MFRFEPEFDKKVNTPTNGKKVGANLKNKTTFQFGVPEQDPEQLGARKTRAEIPHPVKKMHHKAGSSLGMARIMSSNPQESNIAANKTKTTRFIKNSGAQMQSLKDLDRKTKHA